MLLDQMKLGTHPYKLLHDTNLLQNEKCKIKATAATLALPVQIDTETCGYLFIGEGQFTLDAVVETSQGAIGKPFTKDLTHPYLMLGAKANLAEKLAPATTQDLSHGRYNSADEFLEAAQNAFNTFASHRHGNFSVEPDAYIFAFANEYNKWDILVAKGDKLVYTSKKQIFVSRNNNESIAISPGQVLVARKGKTVAIGNGNILIHRDEP